MNREDELIRQIPLSELRDSPFQPRNADRHIPELAENIKSEGGIHEPLVVRCTLADPAARNPEDMFEPGFEIVFGHRRKRAAELAGLATVPCIVRSMTDAQVRSAQMSENIQRENMQALEEGAGFKAQMAADGLTAGAIARAIGKSESHVLGRVKLLNLVPAVKAMLLAGDIGAEAALLIARLLPQQVRDLAMAHTVNLDDIATGQASAEVMWQTMGGVLTWLRVAQALGRGEPEMQAQHTLLTTLVARYVRTGQVAFAPGEYDLARQGMLVMDILAEQVDQATASTAADWAERRCHALQAQVECRTVQPRTPA
jgi:ParB/RepB/Spo0J family partition protein